MDIVLINVISYMGGLLTGLGFCFKYKKHFLLRTSSHDQLSEIINSIHSEISSATNVGPPVMGGQLMSNQLMSNQLMSNQLMSNQPIIASAPPPEVFKEVVIRTN